MARSCGVGSGKCVTASNELARCASPGSAAMRPASVRTKKLGGSWELSRRVRNVPALESSQAANDS